MQGQFIAPLSALDSLENAKMASKFCLINNSLMAPTQNIKKASNYKQQASDKPANSKTRKRKHLATTKIDDFDDNCEPSTKRKAKLPSINNIFKNGWQNETNPAQYIPTVAGNEAVVFNGEHFVSDQLLDFWSQTSHFSNLTKSQKKKISGNKSFCNFFYKTNKINVQNTLAGRG